MRQRITGNFSKDSRSEEAGANGHYQAQKPKIMHGRLFAVKVNCLAFCLEVRRVRKKVREETGSCVRNHGRLKISQVRVPSASGALRS